MERLRRVAIEDAAEEVRALLEPIQARLGRVPNLLRVLAASPAGLGGYLALETSLRRGRLDRETQEKIALAVAEANGCGYCVAAHVATGSEAGLDPADIHAARRGRAPDWRVDAAVRLARSIVDRRGDVPDEVLADMRTAGYDDADVVEVVALVALNVLANYLCRIGEVPVDYPPPAPIGPPPTR